MLLLIQQYKFQLEKMEPPEFQGSYEEKIPAAPTTRLSGRLTCRIQSIFYCLIILLCCVVQCINF